MPWRRASLGTSVPKDGDQGAWKHPQSSGNLEARSPAFPRRRHLDSCPSIGLSTGPAQCGARVLSPCTGAQGRTLSASAVLRSDGMAQGSRSFPEAAETGCRGRGDHYPSPWYRIHHGAFPELEGSWGLRKLHVLPRRLSVDNVDRGYPDLDFSGFPPHFPLRHYVSFSLSWSHCLGEK